MHVISYLQFAGAGLALMWLVVPPVGNANRLWLSVVAFAGAMFATAVVRSSVPARSSSLVAVSLISTAWLGAYTSFAGEAAVPFSLLYLVAAGLAIWCFSGRRATVQIAWLAAVFALATWIYRSPGEPPWPRISESDLKNLFVWGCGLFAVALLIKGFKRVVVDRDQRLAAIVGSSEDAIMGVDCGGTVTIWNRGAERLYGYASSEVIGQPIVGLLVPQSRSGEDQALLLRVLAGEQIEHYSTERVRKNGSAVVVSMSISPIEDPSGRVIGVSTIAHDVTSGSRLQRQIAMQAELLDEVDAAVIATDATFLVRYWSRGAEELYGHRAEDAVGRSIADLIVSEASRATLLQLGRRALAGSPGDAELDVHDRHGRVFPVYLRLRGMQPAGHDDVDAGIISVSVDISARREADQALRHHAAQQEQIANLGRRALHDDSLAELVDEAVRIASGGLSADCARVVEWLRESSEFVVRAEVGWIRRGKGERDKSDRPTISSFALAAHGPVIVPDWDQEHRFVRSPRLLLRSVRASLAVRVGGLGSSFGTLEVHYVQPQAVPAASVAFLESVAHILAEAIYRRAANEAIRTQALHDGLTGLPNRTLFHDRVSHALAQTDRRRRQLAVFLIDLDQFKLVNESLGHDAGDELLRLLAPRLAGAIRPGDTLARLGGDQFAVLCEGVPSEPAARRIANQIISRLDQPVLLRGEEQRLSASIGISLSSIESTATSLLRDVDVALHHAKRAGGRRFELFDRGMRERVLGRVRTESALRAALANEQEIHVQYQPLISLQTGRIVGAEALARWRHPEWGPVSPIEFIPVAEETGLIHELGAQVARRALRESAAWQDIPDFAGIAINASTSQLTESDELPTLLSQAIEAADMAPGFVTVEVTESLLIEQLDVALSALKLIKRLGVHLSLDDFGTGFSSLSYLRDLPLDTVKIDRSLIKGIVENPRAADIPAAILQMAHALGLKVVAEGIETAEQASRLQRLSCDIAQGFYFAKPMGREQLTKLLHDQPAWLSAPIKEPVRAPRQQRARVSRRAAPSGQASVSSEADA